MTDNDAPPADYLMGWAQGVADAGARLCAVVAGELGPDHPLVDRMVERLGAIEAPCTRQDMARAWDQGWVARSDAESRGPSVIPPNPYGPSGTTPLGDDDARVIPPEVGAPAHPLQVHADNAEAAGDALRDIAPQLAGSAYGLADDIRYRIQRTQLGEVEGDPGE